jgi:hypothetical protein
MALKLVLKLAQESGVSHIQIYGDLLLVIQWMCKEITLRNFTLQPLFNDVQSLLSTFSLLIFNFLYKAENKYVRKYVFISSAFSDDDRKLCKILTTVYRVG